MPKSSRSDVALLVLSGTLALVSAACSSSNFFSGIGKPASTPSAPTAEPVNLAESPLQPLAPASPTSGAPDSQPKSQSTSTSTVDPYELALDQAASAFNISESAQSQEDWKLVASRWQAAVALMKAVPTSSPYKKLTKTKIPEYQRNLVYATRRAASSPANVEPEPETVVVIAPKAATTATSVSPSPPKRVSVQSAKTQQVFQAPIKRRAGGTPVIDVTFNGNQTFEMIVDTGASGVAITPKMAAALGVVPTDKIRVDTASARGVEIPIGAVKSIEVNGAVVKDIRVAIAGPDLETGLLGQEFFGNYDVTFKQDVIEFRPHS